MKILNYHQDKQLKLQDYQREHLLNYLDDMVFLCLALPFQIYIQIFQMPKIVISDTSTLILFHKIEHLNLLKDVYGELTTTPEIAKEFGEELPKWIKVESVSDKKYQEFLETQVDLGEASAIALAKEFNDDTLLLLDDLKARKLAVRLNLKITGTLGIIHKAKQMGIIGKIKPIINLLLETDFRISNKIVEELLVLNNENTIH